MAFQTSTLVNGQWITTTLGVDQVLQAHDQKDKQGHKILDVEGPPSLGLLTQTVIGSPLVHWILPARLRSPKIQDVAFIGDDFVQIRELGADGLLSDVTRRDSFGARIRNACVVGSIEAFENDPNVKKRATQVKDENGDIDMNGHGRSNRHGLVSRILPPQFLFLQLQNGDSVFLMLHQDVNGELEMRPGRFRISKNTLNLQPGMHIAVDPSSRYMAIGCSEGVFAIYALNSREELQAQFADQDELQYVEAEHYIRINGTIVNMAFLFPSPTEPGHVILLALVVIRGRTRMVTWEWPTGRDLKSIRAESLKGHALSDDRKMPQLLIPLRTNSTFILVCEDAMVTCSGLREGSPTFVDFQGVSSPPSELHHGAKRPLWVAWARPARVPERIEEADDIYIVREDGLVKFLEVEASDGDVRLDSSIGELGSNCGSALACLDYVKERMSLRPADGERPSGDLLVTGGDSCSGGTYLVQAKGYPSLVEPIQNWAPAQDFVTTYSMQDRDIERTTVVPRESSSLSSKPDRIFSCGGKEKKGAITEHRRGLAAPIGLEMEYEASIVDAWVLYPDFDENEEYGVSHFLLSMEDRSAVLRLSADASDVLEIGQNSTKLDLGFRTVTAAMQDTSIVQITEQSAVLISASFTHNYGPEDVLRIQPSGTTLGFGTSIYNGVIGENVAIFTTYFDKSAWLQLLPLDVSADAMHLDSDVLPNEVLTIGKFSRGVTALAIGVIKGITCAIVAERVEDFTILTFQPVYGGEPTWLRIPSTYANSHLESIISIKAISSTTEPFTLLCGTRDGVFITIEIDLATDIVKCRFDRLGNTSVIISKDDHTEGLFFANCDLGVYAIVPSTSSRTSSKCVLPEARITQVWLCNNSQPDYQPPVIAALARIRPGSTGGVGGSMLFVAGAQVLIARISTQTQPVPRRMKINCTPTRLMFSSKLPVLVVAATRNEISTLLFIDPETGRDISAPIDASTKKPREFVSGLGHIHEKILRLFEWTFAKDDQTWYYIVAATSNGRLLVFSIENLDELRGSIQKASHLQTASYKCATTPDIWKNLRVRYSLKHKFRGNEPATAAIGYPGGIIWCNGTTLSIEALAADKKFRTMGTYNLPSPAISISYKKDTIYVLTRIHSLEILKIGDQINGPPVPNGSPHPRAHKHQITRTHGDQVTRAALHHAMIDLDETRPIHLISDKMCSIAGLWPTKNTKADTLEPVFEAQLPYSVLRFRFGKCRPIWDPVWNGQAPLLTTTTRHHSGHSDNISNGHSHIPVQLQPQPLSSGLANSEFLGMSITGAFCHFTILDYSTWTFLRLISDLAVRSEKVCESSHRSVPEPSFGHGKEPKIRMHIDGDILKRVLEMRALEELLVESEGDGNGYRIETKAERFVELLTGVERPGGLPAGRELEWYIQQAYEDLAFLLRPVL